MDQISTDQKISCYHCGESCQDHSIQMEGKDFCCHGCKMVFEILSGSDLCSYYSYTAYPGASQQNRRESRIFEALDDSKVRQKLITFSDGRQTHVTFYLPIMHCSSCIWLLEHLPRLNKGVIEARVNFLKKEIAIVFQENLISLRQVAELLSSIGYEPHLSLQDLDGPKTEISSKSGLYKIGIAGFCFGNIMMLSFPEYFSSGQIQEEYLKRWFSWINLLLSLPVFFYCATEFFTSAWKGLQQRFLNIDAPIALAIFVTFAWSVYAIVSGTGPGYMDSMAGIVFFMLLGRYFQNHTYNAISFDRDYKSYFPVSVTVVENNATIQRAVSDLKTGMRLLIHNNEILPADAILFKGKARIDYSFVTGESEPVAIGIGELIYAGGKHTGQQIEVEVIREVSQSYLTGLWNKGSFKNKVEEESTFIHTVSRHFSLVVLGLSVSACIYWLVNDPSRALLALTTPLIVACPCALLLSATFTNGNMLRIFGRNKFFLKNAGVLAKMAEIKAIVFDKTGTLTLSDSSHVVYEGKPLEREDIVYIKSIAIHTTHPFSKTIRDLLPGDDYLTLDDFDESSGQGVTAYANGHSIKIGTAAYTGALDKRESQSTKIYYQKDGNVLGYFAIRNLYRNGFENMLSWLGDRYNLAVLSGDKDSERKFLMSYVKDPKNLLFNQKPEDKLHSIQLLKQRYGSVLMFGDGLNDAGALKESTVGIAVSDNINNFSPACDAILEGSLLTKFPRFMLMAHAARRIIIASFAISLIYNVAGLYFALQGELSPIIAAILMPLSSVSIVLFTTVTGTVSARWYGLR